ncbi:MAG: RsmG family class I SAM-dependent methyltransferase [Enhygromyxa sp.]
MSEAILREGYQRLGLTSGARDIPKLLILKDFLKFYGRSMNLTASLEDAALDEHLLEALGVVALARRLDIQGAWLDIGSGGGFPGLVLAACLSNELTLVEPRAKRASVLELALGKLRRPNARVLRGRIEGGKWIGLEGGRLEPGFAAASARAVFEPQRWLAEAGPWVEEDGVIVVHLGVGEKLPEGAGAVLGRVDGSKWSAVAVKNVPRGTAT